MATANPTNQGLAKLMTKLNTTLSRQEATAVATMTEIQVLGETPERLTNLSNQKAAAAKTRADIAKVSAMIKAT